MKKRIIRFIIFVMVFTWIVYEFGVPKYKTINAYKDSQELYQSMYSDSLEWETIDYSANGNKIFLYDLGDSGVTTLILGNIHGDEHGAFNLPLRLCHFLNNNSHLIKKRVIIVPTINPDGLKADTRKNSNGVDINRNFPSRDWTPVYSDDDYYPGYEPGSEKETQIIIKLIHTYQPEKIISIHSNQNLLEYTGPAQALAGAMTRHSSYRVLEYEGGETPGSLDAYTGIDLGIPTITLELPHYNPEQSWNENKDALITAINF